MRSRSGLSIHQVAGLDLRDVRIHCGRPVTAPARTLVDEAAHATDVDVAAALAEARARRLVTHEAELPLPEPNARLLGFEVDILWRSPRLVVEFDGYEFHGLRAAFEADRRRDQVLTAAGFRVIRVTWRQLVHEPFAGVARLAQALTALAAAPEP